MKTPKTIFALAWLGGLAALALSSCATERRAEKPTPYPLETCLVCGMKLGDMGKPFAFVYNGQELKVCDQSEKADFDKAPDPYMKKLAEAAAKPKQ